MICNNFKLTNKAMSINTTPPKPTYGISATITIKLPPAEPSAIPILADIGFKLEAKVNASGRSNEAVLRKNIFDILPMPKGRGFLDTNDTCLLK